MLLSLSLSLLSSHQVTFRPSPVFRCTLPLFAVLSHHHRRPRFRSHSSFATVRPLSLLVHSCPRSPLNCVSLSFVPFCSCNELFLDFNLNTSKLAVFINLNIFRLSIDLAWVAESSFLLFSVKTTLVPLFKTD
jgi:hypothetical protein